MPLTSSAKKALKRSKFLRERNLVFKIAMKKAIKAVVKAKQEGKDGEEIQGLVVQAQRAIDKATRRNVLHKNTASRRKSRLAKTIG